VLPYFKRSETNQQGGDDFRGDSGPLFVGNPPLKSPMFQALVDAGKQAGYKLTADFNGEQQEGFGFFQQTIKNGRRWNTSVAYLKPVLDRANLHVEVEALILRVLFENGRAVGIEFQHKGERHQVRARKEVILACGAVSTPQLLMLSGIGDADYLRRFDIPVVANLPGVGQNLQDHLDVTVQYACTKPVTAYAQVANPLLMLGTGMQYVFFGAGEGRSQGLEAGAFIKSRPDLDIPDLQLHLVNAPFGDHGRQVTPRHAFGLHMCALRPESRGHIALRSTNPADPPLIQPNSLASETDLRTLREGVKVARRLVAQKAFDEYRVPKPSATRTSTISSAVMRLRSITRWAPQRWEMTRWLWLMRN
jgi:choline dehydrogenase